MDFQNQFTKTTTDDTLMETVQHGNSEYPFRYYYENIALFDFKCIDWHWHSELEFIYIESGNVVFDIGTVHFELNEGNGIMINSKILHRLQSSSDAIIPNFLFQPSFIAPQDSLIYKKYINPVISSSLEYLVFQPDIPWQKKALEIIKTIIAVQETEFNRDITLEDIARTANISKSTALHLFQNNLKLTPVKYLINYRLKQAALLLINTEEKIATISNNTGFNNVDHFCRTFKKAYKMTPTDYRNKERAPVS